VTLTFSRIVFGGGWPYGFEPPRPRKPTVGSLKGVTAKAGQPGRTGNRVRSNREQLVSSPRVRVCIHESSGLHRSSRATAASAPGVSTGRCEHRFRTVLVRRAESRLLLPTSFPLPSPGGANTLPRAAVQATHALAGANSDSVAMTIPRGTRRGNTPAGVRRSTRRCAARFETQHHGHNPTHRDAEGDRFGECREVAPNTAMTARSVHLLFGIGSGVGT